MAANPYAKLPAQAYWRTGVARHSGKGHIIPKLWQPAIPLSPSDKFLTVGSCFAQHIGRALDGAGLNRMLVEAAPAFLPSSLHEQFGYGLFSFRVGNIYTSSMLLQWLRWVQDPASENEEFWEQGDAFFDPVRPGIEPGGFDSIEDLRSARATTLAALRRGLAEADVFVFTLGLSESWVNRDSGLVYASCPGTQAGTFDPEKHQFINGSFSSILADLRAIRDILKSLNPEIRMLLTVSPVPLAATAVPDTHVLVSTVHSKSVLRAVAGEFSGSLSDVDYFPSYEIVTHPAIGLPMFESDCREVSKDAVAFVMQHFLGGLGIEAVASQPTAPDREAANIAASIDAALAEGDAICDEAQLDRFNEN